MGTLRIGVVGLGRVASKTHIPVIKSLGGVEIVAGAEKNLERADRVRKLFGLPRVYADYEDMYASESLDAVYICLPNFLHADACRKALRGGIHVLCEKPMGVSAREAEEITALAEEKHLVVMPGYKKRYAGNFIRAKRSIEEGLIGKIIQVQGTFITPGPYISWDPKSDWYLDPKWHGVIYDSGCHLIDLLYYLVPSNVVDVRTIRHSGFTGYGTVSNVTCAFMMEGGIAGDLCIGWRGANDILSFSIHGTAGTITVSRDYFCWVNAGTDPVDRLATHLANAAQEFFVLFKSVIAKIKGRSFYAEDLIQAKTFFNSVRRCGCQCVNGLDAVRVHRFLEKMLC